MNIFQQAIRTTVLFGILSIFACGDGSTPVQPDTELTPLDGRGGGVIAFISNRTGYGEVFLMNADGSGQKQVTKHRSEVIRPRWSADGMKLAYLLRADQDYRLYYREVTDLTQGSFGAPLQVSQARVADFTWHPDGSRFILDSYHDGRWKLVWMNIDGSDTREVFDLPDGVGFPALSPDGNILAYVVTGPGMSQNIFKLNLMTSAIQQLTTNGEALNIAPVWSMDGTRIAFNSLRAGRRDYDIAVMNEDGSGNSWVTGSSYHDEFASWSPDGAKVVYECFKDNRESIFISDVNGTNPIQITSTAFDDGSPAWRPRR